MCASNKCFSIANIIQFLFRAGAEKKKFLISLKSFFLWIVGQSHHDLRQPTTTTCPNEFEFLSSLLFFDCVFRGVWFIMTLAGSLLLNDLLMKCNFDTLCVDIDFERMCTKITETGTFSSPIRQSCVSDELRAYYLCVQRYWLEITQWGYWSWYSFLIAENLGLRSTKITRRALSRVVNENLEICLGKA